MTETHIPMRQRSAKAQAEAGVLMPYFLPDTEKAMSGPLNYHLTMVKFPVNVLERLVVAARVDAASKEHLRNPLDNRRGLRYPAMPRETVNFLRHTCLNRSSEKQAHIPTGYTNSYDNIINKIERKGVDVAERILNFKVSVLRLIAATYPELSLEVDEQVFQSIHNHKE
ncbi:MAG: hypothetical protein GX466_08880 [Candidatus Cloacimonetes bacterium]|nr:hypothetical protein [Candidatus Cloacimonadota bacterium]